MKWHSLALICLLLGLSAQGVSADRLKGVHDIGQRDRHASIPDTSDVLQSALQLVGSEKYAAAVRRLTPLFEQDPLLPSGRGSVAYWLGQAHWKSGDREKALSVWKTGVSEFEEEPRSFDYVLADAYIEAAVRRGSADDRQQAVDTYRRLIQKVGEAEGGSERKSILERYLRELTLILPKAVRSRTGLAFDRREMSVSVNPSPGAGQILEQWWQRQDPLPTTAENERLIEHLQRSVQARGQFMHEGRLDDRGKVFIRLGEPRERASVGMEDNRRTSRIETQIRRNEFWVYDQIARSAHFLFVEMDPGEYEIAGVNDIFPVHLKTGIAGSTGRAVSQARNYLYKLENVLRELGTFHESYVGLATDVFNRAAWARDNEEFGVGQNSVEGSVANFVQTTESKIATLTRKNTRRRIDDVPLSHSSVKQSLPDLPVASRTARYLSENGETRVDLYWSVLTSQLRVPDGSADDRFKLLATLVQRDAQYKRRIERSRRYLVSSSARQGAILTPDVLSVTTSDSVFYLDVQWDQYEVQGEQGETPGSILKRHTERYGAYTALQSDPSTLEMSDIKLLTVPTDKEEPAVTLDDAIPYPFNRVNPTQPLAFSFEIYHLAFDESDKSEYTISYRAERESESDGFLNLLGGDDGAQTTTSTTYQGTSRSSEEYFLLDTENLASDETRRITLSVTVTDEVTDQKVTRSISFRMFPSPN